MAQRLEVIYEDDLTGGPADGTVRFSIDGREYEIDLSKKNADKLSKVLQPYIDAGRKVSASRRRSSANNSAPKPKQELAEVRAWGKSQGMKVSDRGRIPQAVFQAYEHAHAH